MGVLLARMPGPVGKNPRGSSARGWPVSREPGARRRHPDASSARARTDQPQALLPRGFAPRADSTAEPRLDCCDKHKIERQDQHHWNINYHDKCSTLIKQPFHMFAKFPNNS